jgi:hypothetical protein
LPKPFVVFRLFHQARLYRVRADIEKLLLECALIPNDMVKAFRLPHRSFKTSGSIDLVSGVALDRVRGAAEFVDIGIRNTATLDASCDEQHGRDARADKRLDCSRQ